jgi:hypothetical protein
MKTQIEKFNELCKTIDMNDFYSISFTSEKIMLQGQYESNKIVKYIQLEYIFTIIKNGYLQGEIDNVEITFT